MPQIVYVYMSSVLQLGKVLHVTDVKWLSNKLITYKSVGL